MECLGYIEQVFDLLNRTFEQPVQRPLLHALPEHATIGTLTSPEMSIQLQAVSYKYPLTDKVALAETSYTFSKGTTAIVGPNSDGIDTLVGAGFGGQTDLSGGQWQRLALARLIYQDAPVIILDEPVASLDPQGERAIFELFSQQAQSKIIIFTTHRYDSIPKDTKIVVLVDGVLTESGTHEELLQKQADYWSLYMTKAVSKRAIVMN